MNQNAIANLSLRIWCLFPLIGLPLSLLARRLGHPDILRRFLVWIVIIPVFLLASYLGPSAFLVLLLGCCAAACLELARLVGQRQFWRFWLLSLAAALPWLLYARLEALFLGAAVASAGAGLILFRFFLDRKMAVAALFCLSVSLGAGLSSWVVLENMAAGFRFVLFGFSVVVMTDIMAFLFGKTLAGSRPLPGLSPNKTVAGFIGGLASGVLASQVQAFEVPDFTLAARLLSGFFLALSGMAGDLTASWVKRRFGIKDFSEMLGSLGGMLDRLDSLLGAGWVLLVVLHFIS